jgi:hypothetical protein
VRFRLKGFTNRCLNYTYLFFQPRSIINPSIKSLPNCRRLYIRLVKCRAGDFLPTRMLYVCFRVQDASVFNKLCKSLRSSSFFFLIFLIQKVLKVSAARKFASAASWTPMPRSFIYALLERKTLFCNLHFRLLYRCIYTYLWRICLSSVTCYSYY